ncbi:hypothetical protein [Leifsonia sp. fls2-241-R2A-40a]|uniref:hypothetical protein n=1 Tax=Leifsonia sp. fls2-241-R2A-40a TaxID=3040290 RepID=UPI00254C502F|nr:hypothetical protein [Leifsonia sp. fls2-241-R2A-40a]
MIKVQGWLSWRREVKDDKTYFNVSINEPEVADHEPAGPSRGGRTSHRRSRAAQASRRGMTAGCRSDGAARTRERRRYSGVDASPRRKYQETRCNACCTTPSGCGRNFICDCHKTAEVPA